MTPNLRRKVCEVVAEAARNLIDDDCNNQWPEVLQFLLQSVNSTSPHMQEAALRIFSSVPTIFGNQEDQNLGRIKMMLAKAMEPTSDMEIRFLAVRAVGAFIMCDKEKKNTHFKEFAELLPMIIVITVESIEKQDDQSLLKTLIDMTEVCPKFLKPQLEVIFAICMKVS